MLKSVKKQIRPTHTPTNLPTLSQYEIRFWTSPRSNKNFKEIKIMWISHYRASVEPQRRESGVHNTKLSSFSAKNKR